MHSSLDDDQSIDERERAFAWLKAAIDEAQAEFDRGEGIPMTRELFMQIVDRAIGDRLARAKRE